MTPPYENTVTLPDEAATRVFAGRLAAVLGAGDVIGLHGQIGAGKTFLARSMIQHLLAEHGLAEDIPSPTFTLVQTYRAGDLEIWHSDLYRLSDPFEAVELGLEDAFETGLCLIEWPERFGADLPKRSLHISMAPGASEDARIARLHSTDAGWLTRLSSVIAPTGEKTVHG